MKQNLKIIFVRFKQIFENNTTLEIVPDFLQKRTIGGIIELFS